MSRIYRYFAVYRYFLMENGQKNMQSIILDCILVILRF